jgi:ABC-type branched-subunit amino acid transport system substrate-binding protein
LALVTVGCAVAAIAAAAALARPAAGDPIVLFTETEVQSVGNSAVHPEVFAGAQAAVAAINKAGGVKGRQLQLITCDDRFDPNETVACARQAASSNAVAGVGMWATFASLAAPIFQQNKIPIILSNLTQPYPILSSPISFPATAGSLTSYFPLGYIAKKLGKTAVVAMSSDSANALANPPFVKNGAKAGGAAYKGTVEVPSTAPDVTSYVLKVKELGADYVVLITPASLSLSIVKAANAIGFHPLWASSALSITEGQLKQSWGPLGAGIVLAGPAPAIRSNLPGMKRYMSEVTANGVAPDDFTLRGPGGLVSWLSVYAFAEVAKTINGPITNLTMLQALQKLKKPIDLMGLYSWNPGKRGPTAFPRVASATTYFTKSNDNLEIVDYGKALPSTDLFKLMKLR